MQKSFLEKLNESNYGKRGMYIAGATIVAIVLIKVFVTPQIEHNFKHPNWLLFKSVVETIETIAVINTFAFFGAILLFREKIGHKIMYAMQLRDTSYFKDKWILYWIKSLWICFIAIGFTTVIKQSLFKSWESFFFLLLLLVFPFFILPKLRKNNRGF